MDRRPTNQLTDAGFPRQLLLGTALLVCGSVLAVASYVFTALSASAVWSDYPLAFRVGLVGAGALVPAVLFIVVTRLSADVRIRRFAAAVSGVTLLGLLVVAGTVPIDPAGDLTAAVGVGLAIYGLASLALLGALLIAVQRADRSRRSRTVPRIDRRSPSAVGSEADSQLPTDGGEANNELYFPTDDEEPNRRRRER